MRMKAAFVFFLASVIFSCIPAEKKDFIGEQRAAIADVVIQLAHDKFDALLNLDIKRYAETISPDIVIAGDGGYINADYEALIESSRAGFKKFESVSGKIDISHVEVLGPDAAVLNWKVEITVKRKDGNEFSHGGLVTAVMAQRDGAWKIIREHESGYKVE